ncbi:hypothetical protein BD289DRAFT_443430 [Coniella lustricola]|uniref:Uncharacterized protein n=1 Tax=Coniella lustricola TaxID=2025994 RepID=A0A2T2ZX10_9PEZI|nr:hypothetical protein BD289DRAFT_443430 [Coniella lustricola]
MLHAATLRPPRLSENGRSRRGQQDATTRHHSAQHRPDAADRRQSGQQMTLRAGSQRGSTWSNDPARLPANSPEQAGNKHRPSTRVEPTNYLACALSGLPCPLLFVVLTKMRQPSCQDRDTPFNARISTSIKSMAIIKKTCGRQTAIHGWKTRVPRYLLLVSRYRWQARPPPGLETEVST